MDIGKRLYEFRLAKGLSVADLEACRGVLQNHIVAVEEGTLSAPVTRANYNELCQEP